MSQYKSAIRSQPPSDLPDNPKYRQQARQLQELFPSWSNDDLHSLLTEVGGDVELAATRITDGVAEQWGEVSRKKDKKAPVSTQPPKDSFPSRGDSRGGRGGRGSRGGSGRGGASVRGRGGPPRGGANGHISRTQSPHPPSAAPVNGTGHTASDSANKLGDASSKGSESHDHPNSITPSTSGWTEASSSQPETSTSATSISTSGSAWGGTSTASTWGGDTDINGSTLSVNLSTPTKVAKSPATSKLSWAQIARQHEKPAAPPPPVASQTPATPLSTRLAPSINNEASDPEVQHGWEEPTTVQAPTWDDETPVKLSTSTADAWPPATEPPPEELVPEQPEAQFTDEVKETAENTPAPVEEAAPEPKVEVKALSPALATPALPSHVTATPSPKLAGRSPSASHRSSARYKVTDQPVVMPSSFGSGIEKVGMQFGSLGLGGESLLDSTPSELDTPSVAPEAAPPPVPQAKHHDAPAPPPVTAPAASASSTSVFQQQQAIPQQAQQQSQPSAPQQSTHHVIPNSISQPIQSTHITAASPIQQYAQQQQAAASQHQQSLVGAHLQQQQQQHQQTQPLQQHIPQLPQQVQPTPAHHSYAQHGLPTHIDPSQQQQIQSPAQQQPLQTSAHSSYFRQSETVPSAPYFHTSTPPAGQIQDSPYGSFGQVGAQSQHQQGSSAFGSGDYSYADSQRGFYDTYAQQSGFGNRGVLGHDDVKGIPGSQQQPPTSAGLQPSGVQASQQHGSSQTTGQPSGGQGPQQYQHPPVPYYYPPFPQSQYYSPPYSSGYGVPQPFVKYPAMFQPGPPGPASAPTPTTKQSGANVGVGIQPQSYNQALYQQASYDDYQPHPHQQHHQHQHQQHSHNLGLGQGSVGVGSTDYGKQLYGQGQGAMQGFMGLGGQTSGGTSGPTSSAGPRGGGSPETAYKPYAAKDVGVPSARGSGQQQGVQVPGQAQQGSGQGVQGGPQGQSFYGGNRFGSGVGGAGVGGSVGGPQQNTHHQQGGPQGHIGYPQGANDGSFYSYQAARQQQGYWQ